MKTKNQSFDFELEVDSRELTSEELLEIKDFIQKNKDKNLNQLNIQKSIVKRIKTNRHKV